MPTLSPAAPATASVSTAAVAGAPAARTTTVTNEEYEEWLRPLYDRSFISSVYHASRF